MFIDMLERFVKLNNSRESPLGATRSATARAKLGGGVLIVCPGFALLKRAGATVDN